MTRVAVEEGITLTFRLDGADILHSQVIAVHDDVVAGQLQLNLGGRRREQTAIQRQDHASVLQHLNTRTVKPCRRQTAEFAAIIPSQLWNALAGRTLPSVCA